MSKFSLTEYLASFTNYEKDLGQLTPEDLSLERVSILLQALGNPQEKLKFVHVAGSKGKGSTCAFVASILRESGYRVGLFTSPHLYSVCERIRVLEPEGMPSAFEGAITEEGLEERFRFYQSDIDRLRDAGLRLTYFEVLTAIAMTYFSKKEVRIVVLETGLGGRLDATNVFETMVAAITAIGLEHTAILGSTLAEIAEEKSGIIESPNQKVVLSSQLDEAQDVILKRCESFGIVPTIVGENLSFHMHQDGTISVSGRREYSHLSISLKGWHQMDNALTAIGIVEALEPFAYCITAESVKRGLGRTVFPARFEVVQEDPKVIIDGAHTVESVEAVVRTFQDSFPNKKATLVFGVSVDKSVVEMARALAFISDDVIVSWANNERARKFSLAEAKSLFPGKNVFLKEEAPAALKEAFLLTSKGGIILATGSLFFAAEIRKQVV